MILIMQIPMNLILLKAMQYLMLNLVKILQPHQKMEIPLLYLFIKVLVK